MNPTDRTRPNIPSWIVVVASVLFTGWAGAKVNGEDFSLTTPGTGLIAGAAVGLLIGGAIFLDSTAVQRRASSPIPVETPDGTTAPEQPVPPARPPSEWLAVVMLVIPLVAAAVIWQRHALHLTVWQAVAVSFLAIVVTSVLGYIDARRLRERTPTSNANAATPFDPALLYVGLLALWLLCFPIYFFARRRMGARNLGVPAVVVTLLFMAPTVADYFTPPELPPVDAREVVALVTSAIEGNPEVQARKGEIGEVTVSEPVEVSFDPTAGRRVAQAKVNSKLGTQVIYYTVEWHDRRKGVIRVQVVEKP